MEFWSLLYQQLEQQHNAVLMYVLKSEGSSPGRQGFKMWVSDSGLMKGSIGGGIMEHKLVELCKEKLSEAAFKPFIKKQIHKTNIEKDKSGMICSGEQVIAFYYLGNQKKEFVEAIIDALQNRKNQSISLTDKGILVSEIKGQTEPYSLSMLTSTEWGLHEVLGFQNKLYIIGGGHVGLALSKIAKHLDFDIYVLDDRVGLNTVEENQCATFVQVEDYQSVAQHIKEGSSIYVVLMSFGYRTDKTILKQLLGKNYKYLGMMGSKKKVDKLFEELSNEGYSSEHISHVYAPIGIRIKSETPEEIAVSVLGQIIDVKNKH